MGQYWNIAVHVNIFYDNLLCEIIHRERENDKDIGRRKKKKQGHARANKDVWKMNFTAAEECLVAMAP